MEALVTAVITMLLLFGLLLCLLAFIAAWKAGSTAQLRSADDRLEHQVDRKLVDFYGPGPMARWSYLARNGSRSDRSAELAVRARRLPPSGVAAFTPAAGTRPPVSDGPRVPSYLADRRAPGTKPELAEGRLRTAGYVKRHGAKRKPRELARAAA